MSDEEVVNVDDGVAVWSDPTGGITIKAVTPEGDPVELSYRRGNLRRRSSDLRNATTSRSSFG